MRVVLICTVLVLAGCTTAPVHMRNPQTGSVAQCGPYPSGGMAGLATPEREAQCIRDFKEQGYVRVAD